MTGLEFIILGLATWRVASLLSDEVGPFGVCEKLRGAIGVKLDDYSEPYGTNWLANIVVCIWCVSMFVGLAWAALWWLAPTAAVAVALPFALSAWVPVLHSKNVRIRRER